MKNVIVLFGKPGAGKGTRLSEFLEGREEQFEVLSVGNLLRRARKERTELGKKAEEYMDSGELVPDEVINKIVFEGINEAKKTVFIDGFPRTIEQAKAMLDEGIYPDLVVEFFVEDDVVIQRAKDRIVCDKCGESYTINYFKSPKVKGICDKCGGKLSRREDDKEDVVRNRLEVYKEKTYPALKVLAEKNIKIYTIDNSHRNAREKFAKLLNF